MPSDLGGSPRSDFLYQPPAHTFDFVVGRTVDTLQSEMVLVGTGLLETVICPVGKDLLGVACSLEVTLAWFVGSAAFLVGIEAFVVVCPTLIGTLLLETVVVGMAELKTASCFLVETALCSVCVDALGVGLCMVSAVLWGLDACKMQKNAT